MMPRVEAAGLVLLALMWAVSAGLIWLGHRLNRTISTGGNR